MKTQINRRNSKFTSTTLWLRSNFKDRPLLLIDCSNLDGGPCSTQLSEKLKYPIFLAIWTCSCQSVETLRVLHAEKTECTSKPTSTKTEPERPDANSKSATKIRASVQSAKQKGSKIDFSLKTLPCVREGGAGENENLKVSNTSCLE